VSLRLGPAFNSQRFTCILSLGNHSIKPRHQHDRMIRRGNDHHIYRLPWLLYVDGKRGTTRVFIKQARHVAIRHFLPRPQFVHTQATSILAIRLLWHLRSPILHPITSIACLVAVSLFLYSIHPTTAQALTAIVVPKMQNIPSLLNLL